MPKTFNKQQFIEEKKDELDNLYCDDKTTTVDVFKFLEQSLEEAITKALESVRNQVYDCPGLEDNDGRWYYEADEVHKEIDAILKGEQ